MKTNRLLVGIATAAIGVITTGGTAFADHAHFVVITDPRTGDTTCQYLANGTSEPAANHPLHTLVHLGTPGTDAHGTDVDKSANEADRCDTVRGQ
jgi:hypothetical protein